MLLLFGLLVTLRVAAAQNTKDTDPSLTPEKPANYRALKLLAEDGHPSLGHVEVKGETPLVIYVPIMHDSPLNSVSSTDLSGVKTIFGNCKALADHLHETYGVRNILLEGVSKEVADHYNKPEMNWREFSWGKTPTVTYDTWGKILSNKRWHLSPAFDNKPLGPLTLLGREYNGRIHEALKHAKEQGWFQTSKKFQENQADFTERINNACDGYNSKLKKIIADDPGLKREYQITSTQRNKIALDNMNATDGAGVIFYGKGHFEDLVAQLNGREASYIVAVPAGMDWPPEEKDDATIFADMRKLGCQLKEVTLRFGDGGAAKVKLPIE